jgi:hypothetical protein
MTGGKPIADLSQSMLGVSAINPFKSPFTTSMEERGEVRGEVIISQGFKLENVVPRLITILHCKVTRLLLYKIPNRSYYFILSRTPHETLIKTFIRKKVVAIGTINYTMNVFGIYIKSKPTHVKRCI